MSHDHKKSEERGRLAEFLASLWLRLKGYRILERRCKTPVGEIDLIAKRGKTIAFVEVKARTTEELGLEAISPSQRERIKRAAELYLMKHPNFGRFDLRFDALIILPKKFPIHLENAW